MAHSLHREEKDSVSEKKREERKIEEEGDKLKRG